MTAVGDFRSGCVDLVLEIKCLSWAMHFNLMLSVSSGILPPVCEAIQDSSPPTLQPQRSWLTACQATGFHLNDEVGLREGFIPSLDEVFRETPEQAGSASWYLGRCRRSLADGTSTRSTSWT